MRQGVDGQRRVPESTTEIPRLVFEMCTAKATACIVLVMAASPWNTATRSSPIHSNSLRQISFGQSAAPEEEPQSQSTLAKIPRSHGGGVKQGRLYLYSQSCPGSTRIFVLFTIHFAAHFRKFLKLVLHKPLP